MTEYEILLLLDAELPEDRQNEIVTRIRETVEGSGGGWDRHDVWGRRKLAYEIDHKPEGFYHLLLLRPPPETLDEITRVLRITDGVLRHLAVRRLRQQRAAGADGAAEGRGGRPSPWQSPRRSPKPRRASPDEPEPR